MAAATLTLTDFLLARIAEDEAAALSTVRTAGGAHWIHPDDGEVSARIDLIAHPPRLSYASHIARHDPARVLARAAADREMLNLHRPIGGGVCNSCWTNGEQDQFVAASWPCPTARALAGVYVDHADYRPEWRTPHLAGIQCDNYLPPLTCLTAPSSESARCDECRQVTDA